MRSQKSKRSSSSFLRIVFVGLLLVLSFGAVVNRQALIDTYNASQYTPSSAEESLQNDLGLTPEGQFLFAASKAQLQNADDFNKSCSMARETNNPILGCYSMQRIYVFAVTQEKLQGITQTTAAHELLHAAYVRMSDHDKSIINAELQRVYKAQNDEKLEERMAYYRKNEPGEELNELHSILGTEHAQLGPVLEAHYKKYFTNRSTIVAYNTRYNTTFTSITTTLKQLQAEIDNRTNAVNTRIQAHETQLGRFEADKEAFLSKNRNGVFQSAGEFVAAQNALNARAQQLNAERSAILTEVDAINGLRDRYNEIAAEYNQLNQSLDSTLPPSPTLPKGSS